MSKDKERKYRITNRGLPSSVVISAIALMFWALVNILDIWEPSVELDMVKTIAYFIIVFAGLTVVIDFVMARRQD